MLVPYRGKFAIRYIPKTASTAFTEGDMVTVVASASGVGTLAKVVSTSEVITGVIKKTVASTDADYASTTKVPVQVPANATAEWKALTTTNGGQTEVGQFIDASDEVTLDGGTAYTYGVAEVTEYIDSTHLIVRLAQKSGPSVTTA
jgi:hypothetical protein